MWGRVIQSLRFENILTDSSCRQVGLLSCNEFSVLFRIAFILCKRPVSRSRKISIARAHKSNSDYGTHDEEDVSFNAYPSSMFQRLSCVGQDSSCPG